MKTEAMVFLDRLRNIGLEDDEVFSLFAANSSSYQKVGDKSFEFTTTTIVEGKNYSDILVKLDLNGKGKIKDIIVGKMLSRSESQIDFVQKANRWINGTNGYKIFLRPMFSHLPLKGMFRWKDCFRIRPITSESKIGNGLSVRDRQQSSLKPEPHLGPPFPFIIEVAVPRSEDGLLESTIGIKILNQYEALLSVLLIQNLTTARTMKRQWTSIWDGEQINYHLLDAGFDVGEDGQQESFSEIDIKCAPIYAGDDYLNHLWFQDKEILLPPNLPDLITKYLGLSKPIRAAFNRACYWFSLGLENQSNPPISIVAFSSAIECLLPNRGEILCGTCERREGNGATKNFKLHLRKYAPIPESIAPDRDKLYDVRSKLVHGRRLESVDLDWLSPLCSDDDKNFLICLMARRVLVNWLADPNRNDPTIPSG
jgi:hypothetical protein